MNKEIKTWLDDEIDFYDFIWKEGMESHGQCINEELFEDFEKGGNKFNEMTAIILKKFPTKESALEAFKDNQKQDYGK